MKSLAEISLESRLALESAISGHNDIPTEESERNIANNLVEIYGVDEEKKLLPNGSVENIKNKNIGSGLMITTDGWIITACHAIEAFKKEVRRIERELTCLTPAERNPYPLLTELMSNYKIIPQNNEIKGVYSINPFLWYASPQYDLAFVKAVITGRKSEPIKFKVAHDEPKYDDEIILFGLRNGKPSPQYGKIIATDYNKMVENGNGLRIRIDDMFVTDAYCIPGFSGGAITTLDGKLIGLVINAEIPSVPKKLYRNTRGAKVKNIARLVSEGMKKLTKRVD